MCCWREEGEGEGWVEMVGIWGFGEVLMGLGLACKGGGRILGLVLLIGRLLFIIKYNNKYVKKLAIDKQYKITNKLTIYSIIITIIH